MNESKNSDPATGSRSIELEVELPATPEQVWQSLTDPQQLAAWFPPQASAGTGHGATVTFSWGPEMSWSTQIDVWEPGRHLRWLDPPAPERGGMQFAVDWYIEARGARTVLRLVHSGFGAGAEWDEQFEGMEGGWGYFLQCLRHYLAHHYRVVRQLVWLRGRSEVDYERLWGRLLENLSGERAGTGPQPGQRFTLQLADGTELRGRLVILDPPRRLGATVENFNDAHLFVEFEPGGGDSYSVGLWLSTWGLPAKELIRLQEGLSATGRRLGLVGAVAADLAVNLLT